MIGERLQRARKGAGLSLRALAEQAGVSHTAI
ncbi:MAG: helix-turn-helix domain-containing protein, partial [Gammaproteobacteria bacterium]|nr:helix-turn-helix domain-containing protein [Gammaproteobacteria bacterium]